MIRKVMYAGIGAVLALFALSATAASEDEWQEQQLAISDGDASPQGYGPSGPAGRAAESQELSVDKEFESDRGLSDGGPTALPE
jgi:hypothetical protein